MTSTQNVSADTQKTSSRGSRGRGRSRDRGTGAGVKRGRKPRGGATMASAGLQTFNATTVDIAQRIQATNASLAFDSYYSSTHWPMLQQPQVGSADASSTVVPSSTLTPMSGIFPYGFPQMQTNIQASKTTELNSSATSTNYYKTSDSTLTFTTSSTNYYKAPDPALAPATPTNYYKVFDTAEASAASTNYYKASDSTLAPAALDTEGPIMPSSTYAPVMSVSGGATPDASSLATRFSIPAPIISLGGGPIIATMSSVTLPGPPAPVIPVGDGTGTVVTVANVPAPAQPKVGDDNLDGEDERLPAMADDDYSAQLSWQSQSKDNLKVLMDNFSPAQYERFEAYRRHALPKQAVRKVIQQNLGQQVSQQVAQIIAGFSKVFVGEIVESARLVQCRRGETGPLAPDHLREAYRFYQAQAGHVGAARPLRSKRLFVR